MLLSLGESSLYHFMIGFGLSFHNQIFFFLIKLTLPHEKQVWKQRNDSLACIGFMSPVTKYYATFVSVLCECQSNKKPFSFVFYPVGRILLTNWKMFWMSGWTPEDFITIGRANSRNSILFNIWESLKVTFPSKQLLSSPPPCKTKNKHKCVVSWISLFQILL